MYLYFRQSGFIFSLKSETKQDISLIGFFKDEKASISALGKNKVYKLTSVLTLLI